MNDIRWTGRWYGIVGFVLVVFAAGILADRPSLLLSAVVGIVFITYSLVSRIPPVSLAVERTVSDPTPGEDDEVEVTVTVRNVGDRFLPDVRLYDGTPDFLTVTDGTARCATALRPGDETTFSYVVDVTWGVHGFGPITVVARDAFGAREFTTTVATETPTEISYKGGRAELPVPSPGGRHVGRHVTPDGGTGIEFHGIREYQPGDSPGRIDWRSLALTGEMSTIEFSEERAATVTLCLDARPSVRCSADENQPHAVASGVRTAQVLLPTLLDWNDAVGLAAIGPEFCWHPPGRGESHEIRIRELLATHPAFAVRPPDERLEADEIERQLDNFRHRLGVEDLIVLITPLTDDTIADFALSLASSGHAITVFSPDVTGRETPGGRLTRVERANRIHTLLQSGVKVVDWYPREKPWAAIRNSGEWSA